MLSCTVGDVLSLQQWEFGLAGGEWCLTVSEGCGRRAAARALNRALKAEGISCRAGGGCSRARPGDVVAAGAKGGHALPMREWGSVLGAPSMATSRWERSLWGLCAFTPREQGSARHSSHVPDLGDAILTQFFLSRGDTRGGAVTRRVGGFPQGPQHPQHPVLPGPAGSSWKGSSELEGQLCNYHGRPSYFGMRLRAAKAALPPNLNKMERAHPRTRGD